MKNEVIKSTMFPHITYQGCGPHYNDKDPKRAAKAKCTEATCDNEILASEFWEAARQACIIANGTAQGDFRTL